MKKKNKKYWFWRSVLISSVIFGCIIFGILGISAALEGIERTGFVQETEATEYLQFLEKR